MKYNLNSIPVFEIALTFREMEEDLSLNGRQPIFFKLEDNYNLQENGTRPHFESKWNTTTGNSKLAIPNFS